MTKRKQPSQARYLDKAALLRKRLEAGLEQAQLAEACGTSQAQVSNWERGTYGCRIGMLHKLAAALGCKPTDLMLNVPAGDSAAAPEQRERERRMADCARMRAEGLSLRAIGQRHQISHTSVRKLLAEWDTRLPEMPAELVRIASPLENRGVNPSPGGFTPPLSSDPDVITLRRPA
jgi:transcriptional regulator with XRE-family HTH domain